MFPAFSLLSLFVYSFALLMPLLLSTLFSKCLLSSEFEVFWLSLTSTLFVSLSLVSLLALICTSVLELLCCASISACTPFIPIVNEDNKATLPKRKYNLFFCNINTSYNQNTNHYFNTI